MIKPVLITATAITLTFAPPSFAQPRAQPPARATPGIAAPQDQALSEPEVRDVLEIEGYTDIQTFQADGDMYQMRSEEYTSELQSHSFISYAVFSLKKR